MVNMDMIGRLRDDKLDVHGVGTSPAWKGLIESSNAEAKLKLTLHEGGFGPSDHSPFYAAKKPVLFVFTGAHADYHKPSDTADKIDADGIVRVVAVSRAGRRGRGLDAPERIAFSEVEGRDARRQRLRSFRVWVGGIPDFSEEGAGVKLSGVTAGSPAEKAGLLGRRPHREVRRQGDPQPLRLHLRPAGRKPGEKVLRRREANGGRQASSRRRSRSPSAPAPTRRSSSSRVRRRRGRRARCRPSRRSRGSASRGRTRRSRSS